VNKFIWISVAAKKPPPASPKQASHFVIPAKQSASRDRKKVGFSTCYDPGQGFAFPG